jgi:hypothetical protein
VATVLAVPLTADTALARLTDWLAGWLAADVKETVVSNHLHCHDDGHHSHPHETVLTIPASK